MDRRALELVEPVDLEPAVARAGGEHDDARLHPLAGREQDVARVVAAFELHRFVGNGDLDPELLRLAERAAHQRHAGNAGREAEVILDPRRGAGLAAERAAIDGEHRQPFGAGVDGGREPGRPGADDDDVVEPVGVDRADQADAARDLVLARIAQQIAVGTEHDRKLFGRDLEALDQGLRAAVRGGIETSGRDGRCGAGN